MEFQWNHTQPCPYLLAPHVQRIASYQQELVFNPPRSYQRFQSTFKTNAFLRKITALAEDPCTWSVATEEDLKPSHSYLCLLLPWQMFPPGASSITWAQQTWSQTQAENLPCTHNHCTDSAAAPCPSTAAASTQDSPTRHTASWHLAQCGEHYCTAPEPLCFKLCCQEILKCTAYISWKILLSCQLNYSDRKTCYLSDNPPRIFPLAHHNRSHPTQKQQRDRQANPTPLTRASCCSDLIPKAAKISPFPVIN